MVRSYPPGDFCYRREWTFTDSRGTGVKSYWYAIDGYAGGSYVANAYPQHYGAIPKTGLSSGPADNSVGIGEYHYSGTLSSSDRYLGVGAAQHYNKTSIWDSVVYIYPFAGIPPTAQVTATPGTGLCSTVQGEVSSGFGWNGVTIGAESCLDIGPVDWEEILPSWITGSITLPEIPWIAHICFKEIGIGSIEVFGVWIYLNVFVFLAGVVMVVNIAIRK